MAFNTMLIKPPHPDRIRQLKAQGKTNAMESILLGLDKFKCLVVCFVASSFGLSTNLVADHHGHDHHDHGHGEVTQHGAHVHHQGEITFTSERNQIRVSLKGPGKDLIGTESAKLSKAHLAKKQKLESGKWFNFIGSECSQKEIKVHIESHKSSQAEHTESHGDVKVDYLYECASPKKLTSIEVLFRKGLPTLHQLKAQWLIFGHTGSQVFKRKTDKTWIVNLEK